MLESEAELMRQNAPTEQHQSDTCVCRTSTPWAGKEGWCVACRKPLGPEEETICQEADRLVSTERNEDYGDPLENHQRIAAIWSVILGIEVRPDQAAQCMIGVKLARLVHTPGHRDTLVDIAGYAKTIHTMLDDN